MNSIRIKSMTKYATYFELALEIKIAIPEVLRTLPNKAEITQAYSVEYDIDSIVEDDMYFSKVHGFDNGTSVETVEQTIDGILTNYGQNFASFTLQPIDAILGKTRSAGAWSYNNPQL